MFRRCHTFVTLVSETTFNSPTVAQPHINMAAINPRLIHDVSQLFVLSTLSLIPLVPPAPILCVQWLKAAKRSPHHPRCEAHPFQ